MILLLLFATAHMHDDNAPICMFSQQSVRFMHQVDFFQLLHGSTISERSTCSPQSVFMSWSNPVKLVDNIILGLCTLKHSLCWKDGQQVG